MQWIFQISQNILPVYTQCKECKQTSNMISGSYIQPSVTMLFLTPLDRKYKVLKWLETNTAYVQHIAFIPLARKSFIQNTRLYCLGFCSDLIYEQPSHTLATQVHPLSTADCVRISFRAMLTHFCSPGASTFCHRSCPDLIFEHHSHTLSPPDCH